MRAKVSDPSKMYTRVCYDVDLPIEEAIIMCRPEAMMCPDHPWYNGRPNLEVVRSVAPGHLCSSHQPSGWLCHLRSLMSPSLAWQESKEQHVSRFVLRRDFPKPGEASLAILDANPGNSTFVNDSTMLLSRTGAERVTRIHEVFEGPQVSKWMVQLLFSTFWTKHSYDFCWKATDSLKTASLEEKCGYMAVTLKKCCRGLPLLPYRVKVADEAEEEEFQWVVQQPGSFTLAGYLQHLLSLCGAVDRVYDSLDCRRVVPFQAVVSRAHWAKQWTILEPMFKKQRAAYRRHNGGAGAPQLQADVPPRFQSAAVDCASLPGFEVSESVENSDAYENIDADKMVPLVVKNTFVEIGMVDMEQGKLRTSSDA